MTERFVPYSFRPPVEASVGGHVLRPLTEEYTQVDLDAVNSSINIIHLLRGGAWPKNQISFEEDYSDLVEHRKEFERRTSFAYTIVTLAGDVCLGSVYIYPPNHGFDDSDKSGMPADADAAVSMWVTRHAFETGFYPLLYSFVEKWLQSDWPFQKPYISSKRPSQLTEL